MQYQSVYDLIRRALPGKESCFLLREMKVEEAATGQNCYCVSSEGEKIILSGDCVISLCMAFYAYLREECGVNLSWCGNREIAVPEELPVPAVERRYAVPQQHRVYIRLFGPCVGLGALGEGNRFYGDERRQHAALHHRHAGRVV